MKIKIKYIIASISIFLLTIFTIPAIIIAPPVPPNPRWLGANSCAIQWGGSPLTQYETVTDTHYSDNIYYDVISPGIPIIPTIIFYFNFRIDFDFENLRYQQLKIEAHCNSNLGNYEIHVQYMIGDPIHIGSVPARTTDQTVSFYLDTSKIVDKILITYWAISGAWMMFYSFDHVVCLTTAI